MEGNVKLRKQVVEKDVESSWPIDLNNLEKMMESPIRKINAWKILYLVNNAYKCFLRWELMAFWSWGKKRLDSGLLGLVKL